MAGQVRTPDEINELLAELSPLILSEGLRLYYAEVDELKEQDVNPRSMPQGMFEQLVRNIEGAGGLESAPLCVRVGSEIQIISGHHRVRAGRAAGVTHILVYLYEELTTSRIKSKQLGHNTIAGQDDPELVKRVWQQITEVKAQFEAFVDPRIFKFTPKPVSFTQVDVDIKALAKTVVIVFLASQKADFDAAVERIVPRLELDTMYVADKETYDAWSEAVQRVRTELDIVSIPTAAAEMARLAMRALDESSSEGSEGETKG